MRKAVKGIVYQDSVGPSNSKALIESEIKRLHPHKPILIIKDKNGWWTGWVGVGTYQKVGTALYDEMKAGQLEMARAAADFHDSIRPKTITAGIYALTGLKFWEKPEKTARAAFKKLFEKTTKFKLKVAFIGGTADSGTIAVAYTGTLNNKAKQLIRDWSE
jgi:hypothetical protein